MMTDHWKEQKAMSTVQTFLFLIFTYNQEWTEAVPLGTFFEEQSVMELEDSGLPHVPERREVHLGFPLLAPLSKSQLDKLAWMKEQEIIAGFYVKDEIGHEQ